MQRGGIQRTLSAVTISACVMWCCTHRSIKFCTTLISFQEMLFRRCLLRCGFSPLDSCGASMDDEEDDDDDDEEEEEEEEEEELDEEELEEDGSLAAGRLLDNALWSFLSAMSDFGCVFCYF